MIEGVKVIKLKKICDERGMILHMLKQTDEHFLKFGEIYFSCGYPDVVKAWHIHKEMTLNNSRCGDDKVSAIRFKRGLIHKRRVNGTVYRRR